MMCIVCVSCLGTHRLPEPAMSQVPRRHTTFSLEQAVGASPSLALLQDRIRQSSRCLEQIQPLLPASLRRLVKAGPLEDGQWCLLVGNAAASTKLRQLLPLLLQTLNQNGAQLSLIRIKVQAAGR
jgi:hypothetical protein